MEVNNVGIRVQAVQGGLACFQPVPIEIALDVEMRRQSFPPVP